MIKNKLELYECLNKENYLELLTTKLSNLCNNPILTMDYLHRIHSYYGDVDNESKTWKDMIQKGTLDPIWIKSFFHETMKNLIENQKPIRIYYENHTIMLTPVITQGVFMGLIAVLELTHELNEEEIEYTKIMSDILSIYCEKNRYDSLDSEYDHHHILFDLIYNRIKNKKELDKRMLERNWKQSNKYKIYLIDISNFKHSYSTHIRNYIKTVFPECKVILYENNILLLEQIHNEINIQLIEYLTSLNTKISSSDIFTDLFDLNIYIRQVNTIHSLSNNKINNYNEYRFYDLIKQISKLDNIHTYLHKDVFDLYNKDKILFDTLYIYLLEKNIMTTSSILNVHKNTINYRMNKIKENYPNIFNNNELEFHALLTCYLIKEL